MPLGVEASPPSEDQGVCLAPTTTASDDEISAVAYGPGRSSGMPVMRQGSGGLQHLFFACPLAQTVWQATGVGRLVATSEEAFWLSLGGRTFRRKVEWQTIFATIWSLWIHRNEVIFKGRTPSADAVLHSARGFASFWHRGGLGPSTIGPL